MEKKKNLKLRTGSSGIRFPLIMGGILLIFFSISMLSAENYYPPRISYIEGGVSYESAGEVDWSTATINLPVFKGDRLFAKPDSLTELEFGYNSFLRINGNTDVVFANLAERGASINLTLGSIIVRSGKSFNMDVQTRVGLVQLKSSGLYRIDTDESGLTRIMVKKGRAEVIDGNEKLKIEEGQMSTIGGDPSLQQAAFNNYEDDFDLWSSRRDALYTSSKSVEYVGNYYPGVYALDNYGYWRNYSGLGRVWVPRVGIGWSPYRSGLWLDYSVGWTWLSYEPWGWMPYHYGYWHYYQPASHWVWSPGFYGGHSSFGPWSPHCVDFYYGGGYIGWSPRVWGHGSRPNNTVINNTTVIINNNSSRGMTVVKASDFSSRHRVENTMVSNVPDSVRSGFKAGLPENIARTSRTSVAAGTASRSQSSRSENLSTAGNSRTETSTKAGAAGLNKDNPAQSRTSEYKDSRGSAGTVSGESSRTVTTRNTVTTRERTDVPAGTSSRTVSGKTPGLSSGRVTTIPSGRGSTAKSPDKPKTSNPPGNSTRERTTTSPDSSNGFSSRNTSRLSSSSVNAIPASGYSSGANSRSGYSSPDSSAGSRVTSESRIQSMTGTNVRPRVTNDTASSGTANRTYTDRSSSPGFWGRVFGSSSSSSRSSGSYTGSRSSSGSSRSYGSTSSTSRSSGSVSRPSRSISRPSSSGSSSSRPSSSRPRRP